MGLPSISSNYPPASVNSLSLKQWRERIQGAFGSIALELATEKEFIGTYIPRDVGTMNMAWISGNLSEIKINTEQKGYDEDIFMIVSYGGITDLSVDKNTVRFGDGPIVFMPPRCAHRMRFTGPFQHLSVRLPQHYVKGVVCGFSPKEACVLDKSCGISQSLRNLLFLLAWPPKAAHSKQEVSAMVSASSELIAGALRIIASRDDQLQQILTASERRILQSVRRLIEANSCDSELGVDWLVAKTEVSRRSLQRIFNRAGLSISNTIQTTRLRHAADALRKHRPNRMSITQAAFDNGFNSVSYFCYAFRACYGVSPTEYRENSEV